MATQPRWSWWEKVTLVVALGMFAFLAYEMGAGRYRPLQTHEQPTR